MGLKTTDEGPQTPTPLTSSHKPHNEGEGMAQVFEKIKNDYEGGSSSVRALSKKYGINRNKINEKRKEEKWVKHVPMVRSAKNTMAQTASNISILGPTALRKIEELKEELGIHYSPVDEPLIILYARSYERYLDLEQRLLAEGDTKFSEKTGAEYSSPLFNMLQAVQKTLITTANQLGFSMTSRKALGIKLGSEKKSEQSIFDFASDINKVKVDI